MKKNSRNWFWGLIFLLSAVFVIALQANSFEGIGIISIIATIILAAIIIQSLFDLNFFGVFLPLALLYMIYQKPLELMDLSIWLLLLSAVLVSIGFHILFRRHPKREFNIHSHYKHGHFDSTPIAEDIDNNNPYAKVHFGSSSKYLHADSLKSGKFIASFGELSIYFDQAKLDPDGAEIFLDCSFGAMKLFIPRNWKVQDSLHAVLGGVETNSRHSQPDADSPALKLYGNVQFGGVEIYYI